MPITTLEAIRWQDLPTRAEIRWDNGRPQVRLQVLSRVTARSLCLARPVEELPRILTILSPAQHLAAAEALDHLFRLDPPELARTMRAALATAQTFSAHLRKLSFVLMTVADPLADPGLPRRAGSKSGRARHLLNDAMHHLALSREAETILGGRHHHPLTAVAGGVSCYVKEIHQERLVQIAESCLAFVKRLTEFMREDGFGIGSDRRLIPDLTGLPMKAVWVDPESRELVLHDAAGQEVDRFSAQTAFARIGLRDEPWTDAPFAFLQEKGWQGVAEDATEHLFFSGPLARFHAGKIPTTPLAEAEYQDSVRAAGPFPRFGTDAAYRSLLIELVHQAERMAEQWMPEKLLGPSVRTTAPGAIEPEREVWGVFESAEGITGYHLEVDDRARVRTIEWIDPTAVNQGVRCLMAGRAVAETSDTKNPAVLEQQIALAILPF